MSADRQHVREWTISQVGGRVCVDVPWDRADRVQDRLRGRGIGSTLHLDPRGRQACLELWTNLGVDRIRELLEERAPTLPLGRQASRRA